MDLGELSSKDDPQTVLPLPVCTFFCPLQNQRLCLLCLNFGWACGCFEEMTGTFCSLPLGTLFLGCSLKSSHDALRSPCCRARPHAVPLVDSLCSTLCCRHVSKSPWISGPPEDCIPGWHHVEQKNHYAEPRQPTQSWERIKELLAVTKCWVICYKWWKTETICLYVLPDWRTGARVLVIFMCPSPSAVV